MNLQESIRNDLNKLDESFESDKLVSELQQEFDVSTSRSMYDLSMDIHTDVGFSDLHDGAILTAISRIFGRPITDSEKEEYFNAKHDYGE